MCVSSLLLLGGPAIFKSDILTKLIQKLQKPASCVLSGLFELLKWTDLPHQVSETFFFGCFLVQIFKYFMHRVRVSNVNNPLSKNIIFDEVNL